MFTGIVQGLCPVTGVDDKPGLRCIAIKLGKLAGGIQTGASVAINGPCLTVTSAAKGVVSFDVIRETLENTNLGDLQRGSLVNVERSFRAGDEIGGHILSGHVIGKVRVAAVEEDENERNVRFDVRAEWIKYLPHKGFVALDGASLTIARVDATNDQITVCLIPETIARTTLGSAEPGSWVNLEIDAQTQAVVDTVERVLSSPEWQRRLRGEPSS
jgi:riboflavin synthase